MSKNTRFTVYEACYVIVVCDIPDFYPESPGQ